MRRNILGFCLCGLYVAATAACWIVAYLAAGDFKGQFVFQQLPIALQLALVEWLGLVNLIVGLSWFQAYAVLFPLTLGVLYGFTLSIEFDADGRNVPPAGGGISFGLRLRP
jgi:hypothetical protein